MMRGGGALNPLMTDEGANNLAYEIVRQACSDYVRFKKAMIRGKETLTCESREYFVADMLRDVMNFFSGKWYQMLMPDISADSLIKQLDLIVEQKIKESEERQRKVNEKVEKSNTQNTLENTLSCVEQDLEE